MSDEQDNKVMDQRVCLPKPDVDNITVLTKSLPNGPVLPWHHFDSPWLERESEEGEADPQTEAQEDEPEATSDDETVQQLSLELAEPEELSDKSAAESQGSEGLENQNKTTASAERQK